MKISQKWHHLLQYFRPSSCLHLSDVCWDLDNVCKKPNVAYERFFPLTSKTMKPKSYSKQDMTIETKSQIKEKNPLQRKFSKWPLIYGDFVPYVPQANYP